MHPDNSNGLPLSGIRVLDLSTLVPGPMASLMLAEAGAEVIKVERPVEGDTMRSYEPKFGTSSANFALLNRKKRSVAADLKVREDRDKVLELMCAADVVIDQFRPGVVDRLGLGYGDVSLSNPAVVYCSITGYGPEEPFAKKAGHDLNFLAESGLLGVVNDDEGNPGLPFSVIGDIAGGAYPAVMNILLALRQRDLTGKGAHLQISMAHNLQTLAYGYLATRHAGRGWPVPGRELLTGGSPRYRIYRTSDDRHVAVAALEEKFWQRLVELIGLDSSFIRDGGQEDAVIGQVARILGGQTADHWRKVFAGEDICTSIVNTFDEAVEMGFMATESEDTVVHGGQEIPALPVPLDPSVMAPAGAHPYPPLEDLTVDIQWSGTTAVRN